ncbi:hypothetical protein GWI33_003743 [Rhynchophorus ferrugineus]|uniref:Uncharacterized protein n=1 Tax=Rhynchophorus ferrugineus TaxID=354439 RepID=A0A834HKL1_RHYFE|nr:hypothetical protein GWI33_003743 [Rhynchophorus ferrugineus]
MATTNKDRRDWNRREAKAQSRRPVAQLKRVSNRQIGSMLIRVKRNPTRKKETKKHTHGGHGPFNESPPAPRTTYLSSRPFVPDLMPSPLYGGSFGHAARPLAKAGGCKRRLFMGPGSRSLDGIRDMENNDITAPKAPVLPFLLFRV